MPKPQTLFFVKVHVDLHWGFTSRRTVLSKSKDSFLIPPPTTFIGALAYGHAKLFNRPEELDSVSYAEKIRENLVSVNVKVNAPLQGYSDLSRIWWYREREKAVKFDAVALGKVVKGISKLPSFTVVYMFNDSAIRNLGGENAIIASALSIIRVGSKESIASIKKVEYGHAQPLEDKKALTSYSFWHDLADELSGDYYMQRIIDYKRTPIGDYSKAPERLHVYPYDIKRHCTTNIEVKVREDKASIYDVGGESVVIEL